jgi:hypothetical protein
MSLQTAEETHMADPPTYPHAGDDADRRESATIKPRWMSVLRIVIAIVLIVVFLVLHLTGTLGPSGH